MSILEYNGGAIIAMAGKDCVGIASDTRFGTGSGTVTNNFRKVFKMTDKLYVGLAGLVTDMQTMENTLKFRKSLYELREERPLTPGVFSNLLSNLLYQKRFGPYFIEPVVAGLDEANKPFLSAMDLFGSDCRPDDFVVGGTCTENMYGMCESLFKKDMEAEELFETLSQALLASVDRDAISGWGGIVHIITADGVISRELKGRQD